MIGTRGAKAAETFPADLYPRLPNRIQLTTDDYIVYADAINTFGTDVN